MNKLNNIEIATDRFILRSLSEKDVTAQYLSWMNDDAEIKKYISYSAQSVTRENLVNYIKEKNSCSDNVFLGIFLKGSSYHIGNIKFEPLDLVNNYTILGMFIGDLNWRSKGAATEVVFALKQWLYETLNIVSFFCIN